MFSLRNFKGIKMNSLFWLYLFLIIVHFFYYPKWNKQGTESTLSWDVAGYYAYLPAAFIYHDLKQLQNTKPAVINNQCQAGDFYCAFAINNGNYVMKYTMGNALLMLPFFTIAHFWAVNSNYPADGFSFPYQLLISIGCLIYLLASIFILQKLLSNFFSNTVTSISLALVVVATNLLEYSVISGGLTHNQLFFVYSVILYATFQFYKTLKIGYCLLIAALVGVAVLIRPTEIIIAIIPILWGVNTRQKLIERLVLFLKLYKQMPFAILIFIGIVSMQLLYWKLVSNKWLVYTYGNQKFDWLRPHILLGLISFKKGWLLYTPIMLSGCMGFYFLYKKYNTIFYSMILFMMLTLYFVFSWSIWWYATSLGQRAMVQSYAIMVFPLAAFIQWAFMQKNLIRYTIFIFFVGCTYLNLVYIWQAHYGLYFEGENMTERFFWRTLGRPIINTNDLKLLDTEEEYVGTAVSAITLFKNDSIDYKVNALQPSIDIVKVPMVNKTYKWIRVSGLFAAANKEWNCWIMPQLAATFTADDKRKIIKQRLIRLSRLMNTSQANFDIYLDVKIPEENYNQVTIQLNTGGSMNEMNASNIKVECFN
jgi:hypothetical protein